MVNASIRPISYLKGDKGDKGERGPAGRPRKVSATAVPAGAPADVELIVDGEEWDLHFKNPRGLPGVNAIPADQAMAAYVQALDSSTRAALEGVFTPKDTLEFLAADHGVVGGPVDATAAGQALIDSVPAGSTIKGMPGVQYRTQGWTVGDKDITLDFSDSHLLQLGSAPIIRAEGAWSNIQPSPLASRGTVMVPDTGQYKVGDLIKVYADDPIPDARPRNDDEKSRVGEFVVVTAISSSTSMNVRPPLQDTYTTNIRVAKMSDVAVDIRFKTATSIAGASGGLFALASLRFPRLEGRVLKGNGSAVTAGSCYGAYVDLKASDLPFTDGYGVFVAGTVQSEFHVNITRARHAWSDDTGGRIPSNHPSPAQYGRSERNTIYGHALSVQDTAFDTHHGSRWNTFIGCTSHGSDTNAPGFSLRGESHTLLGCGAFGTLVGFRVYAEESASWATSQGHIMSGCRTGDTDIPIQVALVPRERLTGEPYNLIVDGGTFENRASSFVSNQYGRVKLNGPVFRSPNGNPPVTASDRGLIDTFGLGSIEGSAKIMLPAHTSGVIDSVVRFAPGAASRPMAVDLDLDLELTDSGKDLFSTIVRFNHTSGEVRIRSNVPTAAPWSGSLELADGLQRVTFKSRSLGATTDRNSSAMIDLFVSTATGVGFSRVSDPVVLVRLTSSAARTVTGVGAGMFGGQMLVLAVPAGNAGAITIPNGTQYRTSIGSNRVLNPGDSLRLVWDSVSEVWLAG